MLTEANLTTGPAFGETGTGVCTGVHVYVCCKSSVALMSPRSVAGVWTTIPTMHQVSGFSPERQKHL